MIGQTGRICFFRLSENEDLIEAIRRRAEESNVKAGILILIGSLSNVVMGFYRNGKYELTRLNGPLEIASCMGNIAVDEKGEVIIHSHIVVSSEKCEAFGGHLMKESHVGVTAELVIIEGSDVELQRAFNKETKLNLLQL
ncbi:DNA-binding protein [Candidatus Bathyarchaeota archaeon]|nr:DNA-binding protein [Candidatus Bathyarchaeota archaeon]